MTTPARHTPGETDSSPTASRGAPSTPVLAGTTVIYRGRRYTITEEPELINKAGCAWVVNSRGHENVIFIAVDDGRIVRAATRHEPWADVTTESASDTSDTALRADDGAVE